VDGDPEGRRQARLILYGACLEAFCLLLEQQAEALAPSMCRIAADLLGAEARAQGAPIPLATAVDAVRRDELVVFLRVIYAMAVAETRAAGHRAMLHLVESGEQPHHAVP
jgi:hypothetical protein